MWTGYDPPCSGLFGFVRIHAAISFGRGKASSMDNRWMSVDEIAEYLGVSKDTVYSWVSERGMPSYKVGRFWKFKREEVDEWVRAGGAAASSDELDQRGSDQPPKDKDGPNG